MNNSPSVKLKTWNCVTVVPKMFICPNATGDTLCREKPFSIIAGRIQETDEFSLHQMFPPPARSCQFARSGIPPTARRWLQFCWTATSQESHWRKTLEKWNLTFCSSYIVWKAYLLKLTGGLHFTLWASCCFPQHHKGCWIVCWNREIKAAHQLQNHPLSHLCCTINLHTTSVLYASLLLSGVFPHYLFCSLYSCVAHYLISYFWLLSSPWHPTFPSLLWTLVLPASL